jgi:hypothetical protein
VFDIPRDGKPLSVDKDTKEVKVIVVANKKKKKEK